MMRAMRGKRTSEIEAAEFEELDVAHQRAYAGALRSCGPRLCFFSAPRSSPLFLPRTAPLLLRPLSECCSLERSFFL